MEFSRITSWPFLNSYSNKINFDNSIENNFVEYVHESLGFIQKLG